MPAGMVRPRASQAPQALRDGHTGPVGVWLAASGLLGRLVPAGEPYPHICGRLAARVGDRPPLRLTSRDCAACAATTATAPDRPAPTERTTP